MLKKTLRIFSLPFFTILLIGCSMSVKNQPLKKMPTMTELREFYESHTQEEFDNRLREIKPLIDQASIDDYQNIFEESLEKWKTTQPPIEIDRVSVEVSRDDLAMNEWANKKLYKNIYVRAGIYYNPEQIEGDEAEVVEQIYEGVMDALRETPYGAYKINEMTIACYSSINDIGRYGESNCTFGSGYSEKDDKIWVTEQPPDELNIQTIAYEFVEAFNASKFSDEVYQFARHGNVSLTQFGMKPATDELYIGISIFSAPIDEDVKLFGSSLEAKSLELFDLIMADEAAVGYLEKNEAGKVVVKFYTPWVREQNHVYTYYLNRDGG